jgi:hypothetical protein
MTLEEREDIRTLMDVAMGLVPKVTEEDIRKAIHHD